MFWLSLVLFATGWMGENHFAPAGLVAYGVVLIISGVAYWILQTCIIAVRRGDSVLARAVGRGLKDKLSPPLYCSGIVASFWNPGRAGGIYVAVALMRLIPDRPVERTLADKADGKDVV